MTTPAPFSLWIVPDGGVKTILQSVIDRLVQEHGGPAFRPHVTLLSGLEGVEEQIVAASQRLAEQIAPFTVYLDDLDIGETYTQSVFATARPTPELLAAREAAQRAFPEVPASPYRPHLSLLYGTPPVETKRAIIAELRGTLPASFEARYLEVWRTDEPIDAWRRVLRTEFRA